MEKRDVKLMKPIGVETPKAKRASFLLTSQNAVLPSGRRNSRKPVEFGFSPKVKELIQRLRFRLKIHMWLRKARESIEDHAEQVNPGYKFIVKILRNAYRSNENAQKILDFIKSLSFFKGFIGGLGDVQDKAMLELCKHLQYEYVPAGTYIFKEGDPSNNKFYVLLKGSICVIKKKDPKDHYKQRFMRLKAMHQKLTPEEMHWESLIGGMGEKVNEIHEGEGFGEKALTESESIRTASIMTTTNCDLIIIHKDHYLQITTRYDNRRQAKKAFMGKNIPFLDTLNSLAILDGLYSLLQEQEYPKEAIITNENQFGRFVYFIVQGECAIEKTFLVDRKKGKPEHGQVEVKRAITNIGEGSCFGEEVLLDDENQVYKYSVRVKSSSATLYLVEKSQLLIKFPTECVKLMKENFLFKDKMHKARIQDLEKDTADTIADRNHSQTDIKGTELFHLLNPQSRVRMAQQLYNSQRRSLKSPLRSTNPKRSILVLESPKATSIRYQLELDKQKDDASPDAIRLEETSPLKEKVVHAIGRSITPLITETSDMRTTQRSQSPVQLQSRLRTRREAPKAESPLLTSPAKLKISIDPLNKTTEGFFGQPDWITSPTKSKDHIGSFRASPKREEMHLSKAMQEYSFKPQLGPEKFDFGPSPYEKEKVIRTPKGTTQLASPLGSPQLLKDGRSSVFLKNINGSESQQAKSEFTNIVGRLTGGKVPVATLNKLTDLVINKKPKLIHKRLRIGKKEDIILIKSLERQSPFKTPREQVNHSPSNYKRYPKDSATFRLHTALLEDSHSFLKTESPDGSLELSKVREEQTEGFKGARPTTSEKKLAVAKNNLIHLMKTKALAKLKDKDVLKTKAFRFE